MKVASRSSHRRKVNLQSNTFSLSNAKTYLGRLLEKVRKGEPVYIVLGEHRFVLREVPPIDPIPMRPPGYFAHCYNQDEIDEQNVLAKSSVIRVNGVI